MSLGARIKQYREQVLQWEQKAILSKIDGLSQQALSNLETRDSATSEYAIRIADVLGVSVRWLLDGTGRPDEPEWPFPRIDRARFYALDPEERIEIQGIVRDRIERFEAERRARSEKAA